jgi:hypothetical protein
LVAATPVTVRRYSKPARRDVGHKRQYRGNPAAVAFSSQGRGLEQDAKSSNPEERDFTFCNNRFT